MLAGVEGVEGVEGAGGPGQADVGDELVFGGEPRQEDLLLTAP